MRASLIAPELVGRAEELTAIARLVSDVASGAGSTLLISGDAGLGKTALLTRALEMARRAGFRVLRGDCVRFEVRRAFGPFIEALRPVRDRPEVAAALAVAPRGDGAASGGDRDRYRAHAAFVAAFASLAEERTLVVAVDDLHWADEASLELLSYLARRVARGVLLVGTYRPEEIDRRPELRRSLAELPRDRVQDLRLAPLTVAEVGEMLRAILGPGAVVASATRALLAARSGGDPLLLEEMLRALAQRGDLTNVAGTWHLGRLETVPLPGSVKEAVSERVRALPDASRGILRVAATTGEQFDLTLVGRASCAPAEVVLDAMRNAVSRQLVVELEGDRFAFRHPLIRDAILDGLLRIERRDLHRRVAEALVSSGDDETALGALAYHWDEAGDVARAFACHVGAGEHEARRFAHADALAHFDRALQLAPSDDRVVGEIAMRAAAMAAVLGRARRVIEHATAAADRFERIAERRELGRALLAMHGAAGGMLWPRTERLRLLERAFAALEPLGDTPELARACSAYATQEAVRGAWDAATVAERIDRARSSAERAVAMAGRCDGDRASAYWGLAAVHMMRGDRTSAIDALRRGVASCDDAKIPGTEQIANFAILADLLEQDDGAHEEVRALRERGDRLRRRYGVMQTYIARLHTVFLTGEWDEFVRIHDDRLDAEDESAWALTHHRLHRAFIDIARGGPATLPAARAAYAGVVRAEDVSETDTVAVPEVALLVGDHAWALEATERAAHLVAHPHPYGPFMTYAGVYAVLAAREAGDERAADKWLARCPEMSAAVAPSFNIKPVQHTIRYFQAERAWSAGDREAAIETLATLIDERKDRGLDLARTTQPGRGVWQLLTYFMALREIEMRIARDTNGDRHCATERLAWIVAFYRTCGATWYLEQLRERATLWRIPYPADDAPAPAQVVLTAREREVAQLVARGLTNREIAERLTLSVRTAESHVDRIRAKLGLRTRAQIASWMTERELMPAGR